MEEKKKNACTRCKKPMYREFKRDGKYVCQMCLLETGFHVVDMKNMSAAQLANFLTPFIEVAGFTWVMEGTNLKIYKEHLNDKN